MKRIFNKICSVFLAAITACFSLIVFPVSAISNKEKEELYLVDNLNGNSIEWLLNSNNFIYHKQAQIKDQDFWYCVLNSFDVNPFEIAKAFANDDFSSLWSLNGEYRENLKAVILELANSNSFSNSNEQTKIENMYKYVLAVKKYASSIQKYSDLCDKLVESELYYICENYIYGGQKEIEGQIAVMLDNDSQLCKELFGDFVSSNDYTRFLQTGFEYIDFSEEILEIARYSYDVFTELEVYCYYDQQYINFLKYLYQTADSYDIISASGQLLTKFTGTYETNYKKAIDSIYIKVCESAGEYTLDEVLDIIIGKLSIGAILKGINWGISAGKLVSDHFFNTSEMIEIIVTIRAYDELSELLVSHIQKNQATYDNYFGSYEGKAEIASDLLYYVKLLHKIRKNGENAFYRFRSVLYNANITNLAYTFGFASDEVEELYNWYISTMNQFAVVYDSLFYDVDNSLYYGLYEYPEEEQEEEFAPFEIVDNKLIKYNGKTSNVYIPKDITTIGTDAFYKSSVTTVNFEGEYIETEAFSRCYNLFALYLTRSIQYIDSSAFVDCPQLTIYGYSGTYAEKYAKENNIPFEAMNLNSNDSNFVIEDGVLVEILGYNSDICIPYGVTRIGENVFRYSYYRSIYIPETVVSVDGGAFDVNCDIGSLTLYDTIEDTSGFYYVNSIDELYIGEGSTRITIPMIQEISINNLYLPNSMENIDSLFYCGYIGENVFVSEDNNLYSSVDGILYDKDKTTLLFCPKDKDEVENIPSTVANIGDYAFYDCSSSLIILPESIEQFGKNVFLGSRITNLIYECEISLDSIENDIYYTDDEDSIPFVGCEIEKLSIGTSVKTIPNFMFYGAYITSVDLGSHIEIIGSNAFGYCDFENLIIPESVTFLGYECFGVVENLNYNAINAETITDPFQNVKNAKVGNKVMVIPEQLFYNDEITEIEIPDSVTKICDGAFSYTLLTELIIPINVEYIGSDIIDECEDLKKLTYNARSAVGSYSFKYDYVLELVIGENVESLDAYIFDGMSQLETIIWNAIDAGECPFFDISSEEMNVKKVIIGENVQRLSRDFSFFFSENAFTSVTNIEYNAINCSEWDWCDDDYLPNLKEIIIGDQVANLPQGFLCDSVVSTVVIPENVKSIGEYGLSNSEYLEKVTILNKDFDFSYGCFENCPNLTICGYETDFDLKYYCEERKISFIALFQDNVIFVNEDMHIEGLIYELNSLSDIEDKINIDNAQIKAYNINGIELTETDLVGTGSTVYIYDSTTNEFLNTYTIVLYGDVNGDGLINDTDKDIITSVATCTGTIDNKWFLMAADTNHDGAVDGFDVIETDLQALDMHNIEQKNTIAYLSKDETEDETEAA